MSVEYRVYDVPKVGTVGDYGWEAESKFYLPDRVLLGNLHKVDEDAQKTWRAVRTWWLLRGRGGRTTHRTISLTAPMKRRACNRLLSAIVIGGIAAATLGFELVQTRVLSALYYNHVVYLTVTIALMGFGVSGVIVSIFANRIRNNDHVIAFMLAGFAFASFLCIWAASSLPGVVPGLPTLFKLVLSYCILILPFLFAGGSIGLIFMTYGREIHRLYFFDLVSSGAAVFAFVLLIQPLGAAGIVWSCSAVAFAAFGAQAIRAGMSLIPTSLAGIALVAGFIQLGSSVVSQQPELYKTLGKIYAPDWTTGKVEATAWTPIAKIDLWSDSARDQVFGTPALDPSQTKMITQDADAFTIMLGPRKMNELMESAASGGLINALSLTYQIRKNPENVLVIGVGGGIDIVIARAHGAGSITGVEINPATVRLATHHYADYLQWPKWPNVRIVRAEGRNYLRLRPGCFDAIVMSGVDTFSALNSGAYVLSENYLYTVDAIKDYLRALKPDGVMAIYRWFFLKPRESLRLSGLGLHALEEMGVSDPSQSIMVVSEDLGWPSYRWAATFFKNGAFSRQEVLDVLDKIEQTKNMSMVFVPKVFDDDAQRAIEERAFQSDSALSEARSAYRQLVFSKPGGERNAFYARYEFKVEPVYDDRPFFFEYYKPRDGLVVDFISGLSTIRGPIAYYALYILLVVTAGISILAMLVPLLVFNREGLKTAGTGSLMAFFSSLGLGFMFVEVGSMQYLSLYLGDPMYSLMIVLGGLLVFTGVGSLVAGQMHHLSVQQLLRVGMLGSSLAIAAWYLTMRWLLPATMTWPLPLRALVTLMSLLPLGIFMGIPFATGIKYLEQANPRFIPWAWGVNGVTSVMASILAVILAIQFGFSTVVWLGSALYLGGLSATVIHFVNRPTHPPAQLRP